MAARAAIALQRSRESAVRVPERFRAVAPSAVLVERTLSRQLLSRSSHDTRNHAGRPDPCCPTTCRPPPWLAARLLRRPAELDQFRDDDVAMIALDFDDALTDRPAGPTALLESGGQRLHIGQGHRQAGDRRHSLAGPALGLPAYPHGSGFGGTRGALRAYTVPHRPAAIGT